VFSEVFEMDNRLSIGIDPGLSGAIVAIFGKKEVIECYDMPVIDMGKGHKRQIQPSQLSGIFYSLSILSRADGWVAKCWLERQQAMPKQGVSSMFNLGRCYGMIEGILVALDLDYEIVRPHTWQKVGYRGMPIGVKKKRSLYAAAQHFPQLELKKPRGRKPTLDGRADAALIALYGLEVMR
jgi:crossover junction endodeoxyribonuclease RuvC